MDEATTKIIYLAGIVDGEGCIRINAAKVNKGYRSKRYRLKLQITNTSAKLMIFLKELGFYIRERTAKSQLPHWKRCWVAVMMDRKAAKMLTLILPYLIVKKEEALVGLTLQKHKDLMGTSNGARGLSEDTIVYRESLRVKLSELKKLSL